MSRILALTRHRGTRLIVGGAWSPEWPRTMFRLRSFPRPQQQGPYTKWRAPKIRAPILAEASRYHRQPSPTSDGVVEAFGVARRYSVCGGGWPCDKRTSSLGGGLNRS